MRHILIGSKARGDFKDTSDIDIIALYDEDCMRDSLGIQITEEAIRLGNRVLR